MAVLGGPIPKIPKPKLPNLSPGVGPQNIGLPGYRPGDPGNPNGQLAPGPGAPAPLQGPVVAAPAPAAAPPPDFNALTLADPQYIAAQADRQRQNALALQALQQGFARTSQSYQDNANAHGALFSGAAVNAQRSVGQSYADQQAQQAANNLQGQHQDYSSAWQRILAQLAGGA